MNVTKLKQNGFWIAAGVSVVVLVVLVVLVLMPERNRMTETLRQATGARKTLVDLTRGGGESPLVSQEDIRRWRAYAAELSANLQRLADFYKTTDASFERWFEELNWKPDQMPDHGAFLNQWRDHRNALNDAVKPADAADAWNPLNWEEIAAEQVGTVANVDTKFNIVKDLQKYYWIRDRIVEALKPIVTKEKESGKRVVEIKAVDFVENFFTRHQKDLPGIPGQRSMMVGEYPGIASNIEFIFPGSQPSTQLGTPPGEGQQAQQPLGRTFTFGAHVQLRLSDVPNFVSGLLTEGKTKLLIELLGVRVKPVGKNLFWSRVEVPESDVPKGIKAAEDKLDPQPVDAWVSARVLDFNVPRLEEFVKGAQPPR